MLNNQPTVDIAKLRQLCHATTPGPWKYVLFQSETTCLATSDGRAFYEYGEKVVQHDQQETNNLQFIASARTALPQLLDAYEALLADAKRCANFIPVRLLESVWNIQALAAAQTQGGDNADA